MATLAYELRSFVKDSVPGLKSRVVVITGDTDYTTGGYVKSLASLGFEEVYGCTLGMTTDGAYLVQGVVSSTNLLFVYYGTDDGVEASAGENGVDGTEVAVIVFGR